MKAGSFTIRRSWGPGSSMSDGYDVTVQGWTSAHFGVDRRPSGPEAAGWKVTHLRTGYATGRFKTKRDAFVYVEMLEALPIDWTKIRRSKKTIVSKASHALYAKHLPAIRACREGLGGRL